MDQSLPRKGLVGSGQFIEQAAYFLLVLLAAIFAFELTKPLVTSGSVIFTNVETAAVMAILLWLLSQLINRKSIHVPQQLALPLFAWLITLTLSTLMAPAYSEKALLFMGRVVVGILIALATYNLATTPTRQMVMIVVLASSAVVVAVLGLLEGFNISPIVGWLDQFKLAPTRVGELLRVSSTLTYSTISAMVLEMILPLLLVLTLVARRPFWRYLAMLGVFMILSAHVLTLSRAGSISLLTALAVMAAVGMKWGRPRLSVVSSATAFVYLILLFLVFVRNPITILRLTTETDQLWYMAKYDVPQEIVSQPGERLEIPVKVSNVGKRSWNNDGEYFFALSYHLYDAGGNPVTYEGERTRLPESVAIGKDLEVQGQVLAPLQTGIYSIEWDMVQEAITWFSWKDGANARSTLIVRGDPVGDSAQLAAVPPPTDVAVINPTPGRLTLWRTALVMFGDYPVLGVGPDNFRWQYGAYAGLEEWNTGIHANNLYIELLADSGLLGLVAFIWLSWQILRLGVAAVNGQRKEASWLLALGLVVGIGSWYVHGLFDYFYEFSSTYILFWLMLGLLGAFSTKERAAHADRI